MEGEDEEDDDELRVGLKCNAVILLHKIESHPAGLVTKSVRPC